MPKYQRRLGDIVKGCVTIDDFLITPFRLNHPQNAIGYRIDDTTTGASIAYACDHEHGNRRIDNKIKKAIRGCDVVIGDSSFAHRVLNVEELRPHLPEHVKAKTKFAVYDDHRGCGHSTLEEWVKFGISANVREIIGTHHEPRHKDVALDLTLEDVRRKYPGVNVDLAIEYSILEVEKGSVKYLYVPSIEIILEELASIHIVKKLR